MRTRARRSAGGRLALGAPYPSASCTDTLLTPLELLPQDGAFGGIAFP